jgi:DNA-binding XRE family transcriptional regulator
LTETRRIIVIRAYEGVGGRREDIVLMTIVEFRKRGSVERKGMRMQGTVEGNLGFAGRSSGRTRGNEGSRSNALDLEMAARTGALARRIREHREAFACSQQEFAEESGISRATLSKIEQGRVYPSMRIRRKLARALGVGPRELWDVRPEDLTDPGEESREQAS